MPFNSDNNCYLSNNLKSLPDNYEKLQASYNIPPDELTLLPYPTMYIKPANIHPSVGYHNSDELRELDNDDDDNVQTGAGLGKLFRKAKQSVTNVVKKVEKDSKPARKAVTQAVKKVEKDTKPARKTVVRVAKKLDKDTKPAQKLVAKTAVKAAKAIKQSAIDKDGLVHKGIEKVNDVAIPLAFEALGGVASTALYGEPESGMQVGKMAGDVVRGVVKKKTGYGKKETVGKYSDGVQLNKLLDKYVKSAVQSNRGNIVKQVMQEKGLSLPQASKYVKDNNLY